MERKIEKFEPFNKFYTYYNPGVLTGSEKPGFIKIFTKEERDRFLEIFSGNEDKNKL